MSSLKNCANALSPSLNPPAGAIYFLAPAEALGGSTGARVPEPMETGLEFGLGASPGYTAPNAVSCFSSAKMPPPDVHPVRTAARVLN